MIIQKIPISKINPAPYNPRLDLKPGDVEYEKIKRSITEFDLVEPLVWNKQTGNLVGGHQRLKILKEQGITEVEVSVVDLLEAKEKALNIALNKAQGDWDLPKLKDLLLEIDTGEFDINITGFDEKEIEDLMNQLYTPDENEKDDDVPEVPEEPITKKGDLYKLGEHRLLCGDATIIDDVERLMDGQKADMVFTDPPYNIAYDGGTKKREIIKNDNVDNFYQFLLDAYINILLVTKAGSSAYITHADTERYNFTKAFIDAGFYLSSVIIWVKNNSTFGRQDYKWKHEPILYGWNAKGGHKYYGRANEDTVWEIDRPSRSDQHPTMKPIALIERAIMNSSKSEDNILDTFGGSGSTLIACEKLNRKCFMMELDEHYCDVIKSRWEQYTGKEAILL
jgi:DNA modification methylase